MFDLSKYGFKEETPDNQWLSGDLIIYAGLGQDKNDYFTIQLMTLCNMNDVGDTEKIIFRGTYDEMENYLKQYFRNKQLDKLI